ncbi:MAG: hypothetical protein QF444_03915, partial [Phycisphaerales bacterium]|nr:hypothetical protein [Phycisphaerales bacterium]
MKYKMKIVYKLGVCLVLLVTSSSLFADIPTQSRTSDSDIPHLITEDIQAGIEKHIKEQTRQNGGYFPLQFDGKDMKLKLVRVHTEYLANLGPKRHFACVDLASTDGNVYDVDFFLSG